MKPIKEWRIDSELSKRNISEGVLKIPTDKGYVMQIVREQGELHRMRGAMHGVWLPYIAEQANLTHGLTYTTKAWKYYFRQLFLYEEVIECPDGRTRTELISSEKLNTKEYAEWMDKIAMYCSTEFQIILPELDPSKRSNKNA